jgi:hypothetical protein
VKCDEPTRTIWHRSLKFVGCRRPASKEDVLGELLSCLEQRPCPALQELDISRIPCSGATAARCLREGLPGCPDLRRLRLHFGGSSTILGLAAALEQGLYPKLEVLSIKALDETVDGGEVVAAALRAFPRPGLRELDLRILTLGTGLAGALQSGACRGLTRLSLKAVRIGQGVDEGELGASSSACPHLRHLEVEILRGRGGDSLYRTLAEAVREGGLPCLEHLSLIIQGVGHDSVTALIEALEARSGRPVHFNDAAARSRADEEQKARFRAHIESLRARRSTPRPSSPAAPTPVSTTMLTQTMPSGQAYIQRQLTPGPRTKSVKSRFRSLVRRYVALVAAQGPTLPRAHADATRLEPSWAQEKKEKKRKKKPARDRTRDRQRSSDSARLLYPAPSSLDKAILGPGSLLQEEMLLAPFLDTPDLMPLSEAAKWLKPYRHQLGEILVKRGWHYHVPAELHVQRRLHTIRLEVLETQGPLVTRHEVFGLVWAGHERYARLSLPRSGVDHS